MYKSKSADRPSTPKLSSIALPLSPELRAHTIAHPPKPAKTSSWLGFLRPSSRPVARPSHNQSWSSPQHIPRPASSGTDEDDDDDQEEDSESGDDEDESEEESEEEVVYRPQSHQLAHPRPIQARPSITLIRQKTQKEIDMEEQERRDAKAMEQMVGEIRRRVPSMKMNGPVSTGKSKAAKEIEMEREEREREELQRHYQRSARQEPRPLKSCLKGSSQKSSPSQEAVPALSYPVQHLKRRESSAGGYYYSDTEQLHHQQKPTARRQTLPISQPPTTLPSGHPTGYSRSRGQSISDRPTPPIINPANYVKAYCKEVPMKPEAIALSWPLVDFQTRKHVRHPALFFDAAFNPRYSSYEVKILPYGGDKMIPLQRETEVQLVSPHAFMSEMILYNETLLQWPIVIRHPQGVRIIDVFRAIHDNYSIPLTEEELRRYRPSEIERCQPAFEQRCRDGPGLERVVKSKGLCRVDLLRSKKFFKGLTPYDGRWGGSTGANVWELHFERIDVANMGMNTWQTR